MAAVRPTPQDGWLKPEFTGYEATLYDYYIMIQPYDADIDDALIAQDQYMNTYGASSFVKMKLQLPTPIVEFCKLTKNDRTWYVRLVNAYKFTGLNATITVYVGSNELVLTNPDPLGIGITGEWGATFLTDSERGSNPGSGQYLRKSAIATAPGFDASDEFVIGKSDDCNGIVNISGAISRRHCVIKKTPDSIQVSDLGSTNGTWLNGEKLEPNTFYQLHALDELKIADITFRLFFE